MDETTQNQSNPISPKPPTFPTWAIIVLTNLISLVVGLAISNYFLKNTFTDGRLPAPTPIIQATPMPTLPASPTLESDTEKTYEFLLPVGWVKTTSINTSQVYVNGDYQIEIQKIPTSAKTIKEFLATQDKQNKNAFEGAPFAEILSTKITTINSYSVIQRQEKWLPSGMPNPVTVTYYLYNKTIYAVNIKDFSTNTDLYAKKLSDYNQVVSSFKFTSINNPIPKSIQLFDTSNWQIAQNSSISLLYPGGIYSVISTEISIYLTSLSNPNDKPEFAIHNYDGGSRRTWYNNYFSYYPSEVKFTEKQLGSVSALYATYSAPPSSFDSYIIGYGKKIVLVLPQGADPKTLETIISTIKFN